MPSDSRLLVVGGAIASAALTAAIESNVQAAQPPATVTFSRDIAPIVFQHCAPCHRPGEAAPFSLLSYADVRQHAKQIAAATRTGYMPPWAPEPGFGEFTGVRRLTERQIALIQDWVDQGAVAGDQRDLPSVPQWPGGWRLGTPDLVVTMPEPYRLKGEGADIFRSFVIRIPETKRRYVRGVEFHPGTSKAIHHENMKIDQTPSSRREDDEDSEPGFDGSAGPTARFPDGHFMGWTPGQMPRMLPEGMAWRLEPGSDLIVELHMMPTGKAESIQVSVGLFFTNQPPSRLPAMLRLGRQSIDIPGGEKEYVITDAYTLPVDVDALEIYPHAHYLAKEISGIARLPDGTTKPLIYIKAWNFNWQDSYRYAAPVALPRGSTLQMRYTYDNSADNPRNPSHPPRRVIFGPTTTAEMGDLWIQVVPRNSGDLTALLRDAAAKMVLEDIAGREKLLELNSGDARLRADLALYYLEVGRVADAALQMEEVVRLEPRSSGALFNLGVVRFLQGRLEEAVVAYRQALQNRPDQVAALADLAWILATTDRKEIRDPGEAVRLAARGAELTAYQNPTVLDTLAVAYAAAGQIDRAISTAQAALSLASAAGADELAARIRKRLESYQRQNP